MTAIRQHLAEADELRRAAFRIVYHGGHCPASDRLYRIASRHMWNALVLTVEAATQALSREGEAS